MGEVGVRDAAGRVVAVVRDAGRDEYTVRRYQVVLDRFAAFLMGRGVDTASELVCIDFIANQTGVRLAALHEPVKDRDVQAVRRPVLLMTEVLAGRAVDVDRPVIPAKDGCPARFRPLRNDYLATCRGRGNAEATVVTKDRAASRFLAYLVEVGIDDLAAIGVREVSGFLLRQRELRRKTVAALRSCLADFLNFLAAAGQAPAGLADRLPPHRHVRHESDPHLWTAEEIRQLLARIDRQSATGKRDYAMILTTARLGLRVSDLRGLELGDLDWRAKQITIVQHKTGRPLRAAALGRRRLGDHRLHPRRPARDGLPARCSSSTVTPSTRSGPHPRSPPGCRVGRIGRPRRVDETGRMPSQWPPALPKTLLSPRNHPTPIPRPRRGPRSRRSLFLGGRHRGGRERLIPAYPALVMINRQPPRIERSAHC